MVSSASLDEPGNMHNPDRLVDTPSQDRPNRERGLAQLYANSGQITTLMLRNIPSMYTQDMLLEEIIDCMGSSDSFDFFYLPWDVQNDCNVSYAFVNFRDVISAERCTRIFTNFNFRKFDSRRSCRVYPAHIQGLENNLRHLMDRAVSEAHSHYPIIMWKGEKLKLGRVIAALDGQRAHQPPKSAPGRSFGESPSRDVATVPSWPPPQSVVAGTPSLSDPMGGLLCDDDSPVFPGTSSFGNGEDVSAVHVWGMMRSGGGHLSPPTSGGSQALTRLPGLRAPLSATIPTGSHFAGATASPEADMLQALPGLKAALNLQLQRVQTGAPPMGQDFFGVPNVPAPGHRVCPASMPGRLPGASSRAVTRATTEGSVELGSGGTFPREIGVRDPDMDVLQKFCKKFSA